MTEIEEKGWKLYEKTVQLYNDRPHSLKVKQISIDTGLTEGWINNFSSNNSEPSVVKVEILYEYLSKKKLKV